jgi:hypothetical protein
LRDVVASPKPRPVFGYPLRAGTALSVRTEQRTIYHYLDTKSKSSK